MKDDYINEIYDECDPIDPADLPEEEDIIYPNLNEEL